MSGVESDRLQQAGSVDISHWDIHIFYALEPAITRTVLFQSNRSQAVRLPRDVAFPQGVKDVTILRDGKRRIIVPTNALWDDFFAAPGVDLDERDQPPVQKREAF